ncbi:MAG TPA: hypothetical protein VFK02_22150 [Kofleriaceae bacterium]|nr:hypothetical protein [Kofleriaceae bacterium]
MGETDVSFRHLLRGIPRPILRMAFPRRRLEPLGPLDPSVDRPRQRTADNLFRVRDRARVAAVHVEIERKWRTDLPPRLFDYASSAVTATRLPVWSIVVLLRPGGRPPRDTGVYRIPGASGDAFVFRYHVVPLWRLDARSMREELGLEGAPFCVAMRGADEALVQDLAEEVLSDRTLSEHDQQGALRLLYIMCAAILGSDIARRIFHVESIIQAPGVQELIHEWEDKGRAKGRAEGREEGRAEGRAEGRVEGRVEGRAEGSAAEARRLLFKVLAARLFPVTPDLRARIERELDVARLEAWLEATVTAGAVGDVFRDG